ncbi:hypothetical protein F2Q69_00055876 [Brassica cretica]|uniref:Uncharacterized protein n=1 Tax=Brassica cretica TaxID=69181 RepID=A0A8S9N2B0_BRACR|nr:hypothetical protein F2Q69_00055876 [Brassica cretica]
MESKLGTHSDKVRGETSGSVIHSQSKSPRKVTGTSRSSLSDVQPDSSDVESSESSDSELEEGEFRLYYGRSSVHSPFLTVSTPHRGW